MKALKIGKNRESLIVTKSAFEKNSKKLNLKNRELDYRFLCILGMKNW
jgi:hypothetical protein